MEIETNEWGMQLLIDATGVPLEAMTSEGVIREYFDLLIGSIEMKKHGELRIERFGDTDEVRGFTAVQWIKTSCIAFHFAEKYQAIFGDIFSCKKFDTKLVAKFTQEYFGAKEIECLVVHRGTGLIIKPNKFREACCL